MLRFVQMYASRYGLRQTQSGVESWLIKRLYYSSAPVVLPELHFPRLAPQPPLAPPLMQSLALQSNFDLFDLAHCLSLAVQ